MSATHSDVGVRRAATADAEAVGAIQAAVWRQAYRDDLPPEALAASTPSAFAAAWRRSLDPPPGPAHGLLIAHEAEAVVGLAALGPSDDPDLAESGAVELLVLGVDPDHRRVGHGSRLLAAAAQFGAERGGALLTTWVLVNHEATRAFLQGAGFGPDRARRERVVSPEGATVLEIRLVAALPGGGDEPAPAALPTSR